MQVTDNFCTEPGRLYFREMVQKLCQTADVNVAGIAERVDFNNENIRVLALYNKINNKFIEIAAHNPANAPCRIVINGENRFYPNNLRKRFPQDPHLAGLDAEAYCGVPLKNSFAEVTGGLFLIHGQPLKDADKYFAILHMFSTPIALALESRQRSGVFNNLAEALNIRKGHDFFAEFTLCIQRLLKADCVLISEITGAGKSLRSLAPCCQGMIHQNMEFDLSNAPGQAALEASACAIPRAARRLWPDSAILKRLKAESYVGLPLVDPYGRAIGLIEVINTSPISNIHTYESLLKVFAARAADELSRLRDEREAGRYRDMVNVSREYIDKIIRLSPDMIWVTSLDDDEIIDANESFCSATGWDAQEILGEATTKIGLYTLDFRHQIVELILQDGEINAKELRFHKKNGEPIYVVASSFFIELSGEKRILTIAKDITERKQTEIVLAFKNRCYQIETENDDFNQALAGIITEIESLFAGSNFAISLLDGGGRHILNTIAPGLPEEYHAAMAGAKADTPGGRFAVAGTAPERVRVTDIAADPLWRDRPGPAPRPDLKTCWSVPIQSTPQELIGTLSGYQQRAREPGAFETALLFRIAAILGALIEQKRNDERLRESRKKFSTLYNDAPSMFFSLDNEGRIVSVNQFGARYLGYKTDELIGRDLIDTLIFDADQATTRERLGTCLSNPDSLFRWEVRKKHKSGHIIWARETAHVININNRREILVVCDDISENQRLAQQLEYQATHDALTRLVNRREFEKRLKRLLKSRAAGKADHAACYLDLDNFKIINDTCGHVAGDAMLKQLSELLAASVRGRDTLARLGGDEFGILIENCSLTQAYDVAKKILSVVQGFRFAWGENKFSVGVSIGLAPINETSGNVTDVLSAADSACYVAKDKGRNRIHVYSPNDRELGKRKDEMQWVVRINRALEENRFDLFYQEIAPLKPAAAEGKRLELLVRIKTADGGHILPGAFLPAAERYNLSGKIDRWVIKTALDWLCADEKMLARVETCAINISGHALGSEDFLEFCAQSLEASRLPPGRLCFEIAETIAIANLGNTRKFISELKARGCAFALDDFGSGLSSFGYLKNLPVDYIKIDGAFIRDLLTDSVDREMVTTISRVGQIIHKKTIAEAVENEATRRALLEIGVDYAQGYAIAKPRPIESFPAG